ARVRTGRIPRQHARRADGAGTEHGHRTGHPRTLRGHGVLRVRLPRVKESLTDKADLFRASLSGCFTSEKPGIGNRESEKHEAPFLTIPDSRLPPDCSPASRSASRRRHARPRPPLVEFALSDAT